MEQFKNQCVDLFKKEIFESYNEIMKNKSKCFTLKSLSDLVISLKNEKNAFNIYGYYDKSCKNKKGYKLLLSPYLEKLIKEDFSLQKKSLKNYDKKLLDIRIDFSNVFDNISWIADNVEKNIFFDEKEYNLFDKTDIKLSFKRNIRYIFMISESSNEKKGVIIYYVDNSKKIIYVLGYFYFIYRPKYVPLFFPLFPYE